MSINAEYLKNVDKSIVLFGAGKYGELMLHICEQNNINVTCFCDNNPGKIGKVFVSKNGRSIPIYSLNNVIDNKEIIFIISAMRDSVFNEIKSQLNENGYSEIYSSLEFFDAVNYTSDDVVENDIINSYRYEKYKNVDSELLYSVRLQFQITERCSLKCKDCSNLMQHYENPKTFDTNVLKKEIDRLTEVFDYINQIGIIGGEPLVNKDVYDIVSYICTKDNVHNVHIMTNGTICPSVDDIKKLDRTKVAFQISDYGTLSKKLDKLCNLLDEYRISYRVLQLHSWHDFGYCDNQNLPAKELADMFKKCALKDVCSHLSQGKIFVCSRAAHLYYLDIIPKSKSEHINIMSEDLSVNMLKEKLKHFLYGKKFINECQYCKGGEMLSLPVIPVAEQTDRVLPYEKYQ